ncbi:MAG: SufS family cysteine desulfurase [Clostridia bacterium]|nr:SufS family cysteine desulfurase [Clostridia bacterium]
MLYRDYFPLLKHHPEIIYLDNAATSQKPESVINEIVHYYEEHNGSPHRGAHILSVRSTEIYERGRDAVRDFIHANRSEEIIFTRNATESLNLIAYGYVMHEIKSHQNIVLSITNHHSNILPFQQLKHLGFELRYLYCDETGQFLDSELDKIDENTFLVSLPIISNGIGVIHDVKSVFDKADAVGAIKLLDAAQGVGHMEVDVQALNADLLVFSGHKMFGPQGIGVLYGRYELLDTFHPFLTGGDMIEYVTEQTSSFAPLPERLEAGTQNVEGVLGLTKAIEFIEEIGLKNIHAVEAELTTYAYEKMKSDDAIEIYGPTELNHRGALITFNLKEVHPHDVASILDSHHIAIRAGHHCCQPLMHHLNLQSTCRVSFSVFNTRDDIDKLYNAINEVKKVFYE